MKNITKIIWTNFWAFLLALMIIGSFSIMVAGNAHSATYQPENSLVTDCVEVLAVQHTFAPALTEVIMCRYEGFANPAHVYEALKGEYGMIAHHVFIKDHYIDIESEFDGDTVYLRWFISVDI